MKQSEHTNSDYLERLTLPSANGMISDTAKPRRLIPRSRAVDVQQFRKVVDFRFSNPGIRRGLLTWSAIEQIRIRAES
jgi:hypothetical protein